MDQKKQACDGQATKVRNAAIYVRVSTASKSKQGDALNFVQNLEVQEQPLRDLVQQRGWEFQQLYSDRASGAKEKRPGLNALMADARRGLFDVVVVWRFDRFARSVKQLVLALEEFRALGNRLRIPSRGSGHKHADGPCDVHDRCCHRRVGAEHYPRTRDRWARVRPYKWHAIRTSNR
jgi:hypothetical protein